MKNIILSLSGFSLAALMLSGCGQSKQEGGGTEQKSSPQPAAAPAPAQTAPAASVPSTSPDSSAPATPSVAPSPASQASAPATPAPPAAPAANAAETTAPSPSANATDGPQVIDAAASQLQATAKAKGDTVLSSVSSDLFAKAKSLAQSVAGNDAVKSQLTSSLASLSGGNDSGGLTSLYQMAQSASLTPPQLQLAKEVGNLASAYVVQKNFASLDGAQGDVATIVNSLRQGEITPAIPAIQKVAQNANLTPTQKQLVASIADKYAPGVSKAASALGQGLQSIPGLGGK